MKTQLLNLWDTLRSSYWFVPSLFAVGAIALSLLMPLADEAIEFELPSWIRTTPATARSTLSALAGAMVAVTGTVFSVTIVTLSLTSQQLGPRLLRRFMHDFPTQVALGMFLSTGLYCLLLLRVVEQYGSNGPQVPHLGVAVAVVLAVSSMSVLIVFIHHVAVLIQAPSVVASVAEDLDDAIVRLFPEKIGEASPDREQQSAVQAPAEDADRWTVVDSDQEGYIQAIDSEGLMDLACEHDVVVKLRARPGEFIAAGTALADVWKAGEPEEANTGEELAADLNELVIVGSRRTPRQDVECAIEELAEVAVRSLSAGINDPFTAVNCIDRLGASLGRVAEREMPTAYRFDEQQRLRVIAFPVSFDQLLNTAFAQIRHYGRDSVVIALRLLGALENIAQRVHRPADREAIELQAELVARLSDAMPAERDRAAIRERVQHITCILEGAAAQSP